MIAVLLLISVSAFALDNKPERLEWLQDAGFGMFIHWSMDSQLGSVISHSMVGASENYLQRFIHDLPKTFNPKKLDMAEIALLAKQAGMKYIVFTTKHHSGFCMWPSGTTDFDISRSGYDGDIVAEYVKAVRMQDLGVGFYYSPEDFHFLHQNGIRVTRRGPGADPEENPEYRDFITAQLTELMTRYGPVDVMFFDGAGSETARQVCWSLQPDLLVTRGALETPEQTLPGIPLEGAWEACITMGTQWHYKPTHESYKSAGRLIEILIETRAKGGALLLNVGPKPNGELPIEQEERLREIALWHFVNGESIHNVRPWIVTNEGNIWFTKVKDKNTLYAFITRMPGWPKGERKEFVLKSVKPGAATEISVLGQSSEWVEYAPQADASVKWSDEKDGLHVSVVRAQRLYNNSKWPNPVVMKLTHVVPALTPPRVRTLDVQQDGEVICRGELPDMGKAETLQVGFSYRRYAGFVEELYDDTWMYTPLTEQAGPGIFKAPLADLKPGTTYQVRAVVKHPLVTLYGNIVRFRAR